MGVNVLPCTILVLGPNPIHKTNFMSGIQNVNQPLSDRPIGCHALRKGAKTYLITFHEQQEALNTQQLLRFEFIDHVRNS